LAARRLAAIVENSQDAIIGKDLRGVVTTWNKGAECIFGYSEQEMIGRSITALIPQERQAEEERILDRLRHGERVEAFETVRITKDGRAIQVSVSISRIVDAEGQIVGVSKIARDITERKQAEQTRLHLAAIVDSSDDAILSKSLEGIIRSWNQGAERIFGYKAQEIIGKPITVLIPPDRHVEEEQILARLARGGAN